MKETDFVGVLVAIDAGVSTGMVIAGEHADGSIEILLYDQFICDNFIDTVSTITTRFEDTLIVHGLFDLQITFIVEQFDLRPNNKFVADLTTVKVNSALEYELAWHCSAAVVMVHQTPAQAKSLVSNEVLKNLGWYLTGKSVNYKDANDVNDAMRHLVYYIAKTKKNRWIFEGGWPK